MGLSPWLAACARATGTGAGTAGPAAPTTASPKTTLVFQPWQNAYGFQSLGKAVNELMYDATAPFRDAHPSIDLKMYGPDINPIAATIAGAGPDVPQLQGGGSGFDGWLGGSLLLDLRPYVQKSNLDLTQFSTGQLETVTARSGALYALPNYMGTAAVVVNYTVLDELGLAYPPKTWDYKQYADFAHSVAGPVTKPAGWRYGATFDFAESGPDAFYFRGFGGNIVDPADPTHCTLDSPECVAAGEYLYEMIWAKTAQPGRVDTNGFAQGREVAPFAWVQQMLQWVTAWKAFKWDFYPMPTWPKGVYSMTNPNYFAINSETKAPDAAWELLQWLCAGPDWQRAMMKLVLLPPGYLPVWDEWLATVRAVAPTLADKDLEVFSNIVHKGNTIQVDGARFAYADGQAKQLLQPWTTQLQQQKISVQQAFTQAAQQINAFEAAAAHEAGSAASGGAQLARAALANKPAQLKQLPALFPTGGTQP